MRLVDRIVDAALDCVVPYRRELRCTRVVLMRKAIELADARGSLLAAEQVIRDQVALRQKAEVALERALLANLPARSHSDALTLHV